ncbi:MAG: sugar ABC transporter substrate-binding protein [bacterium]
MKIIYRGFIYLSFSMVIAIAFISCQGRTKSTTPTSGSNANPVRLTYMMWGRPDELATVQEYIKKFNVKYPNIQVKILHYPQNYQDKLKTMMAGGTPPDVMYIGLEDFPSYANKDVLLDLQPYINRDKGNDFPWSDFYPQTIEPFKYKGDYYGIAKDFATLVLYYNKDMFDKEKLAYPTDKWTWDDFRSAAEKMTKDINGDGKPDQYGFVLETWMGEWAPWIWQNDGEIMDVAKNKWLLGDPRYINQNIETFQFLVDLVWGKKQVAPKPMVTQDMGTQELFKTGKVGMCTYGRWMCMDFKHITAFKWDVSVLPYKKKRATALFTVCYAISKKCPYPEEAWQLIKFLTGPEGQIATAESGHAISTLRTLADSPHFLEAPVLPKGLNNHAHLDGIPYAQPTPSSPMYREIDTLIGRELDLMWRGQRSPKETIQRIQPQVEKLLTQNK